LVTQQGSHIQFGAAAHGVRATGAVDILTSSLLLELHTADGYKDDGKPAADLGYLYKVCTGQLCAFSYWILSGVVPQMHVPVHKNRSIQTTGTLYSANNTVLLRFVVRAVRFNACVDGCTVCVGMGAGDVTHWCGFSTGMIGTATIPGLPSTAVAQASTSLHPMETPRLG